MTEATNGDVKSSQPGKKLSKPLIDEAYYFSHSRFIERILKNADDEEAVEADPADGLDPEKPKRGGARL